nr:hypothetical protein [Mesorhizobium sp. M8A.F.Ca.ET.165.01.1.1]
MALNLAQLHEVLQASFAWTDSHLHQFNFGGIIYGAPEFDDDGFTANRTSRQPSYGWSNSFVPAIPTNSPSRSSMSTTSATTGAI